MKNIKIISSLLLLLVGLPLASQAQTTEFFTPEVTLYVLSGMVVLVAMIVLGVAYTVYTMLGTLMENEEKKKAEAEGREYVPSPSMFTQMIRNWTNAVPLEEEKSIELDHEYDGIRELDNHLPPWWLALFYGSIVFGAVYLFGYHVADWWPLQEEEYQIAEAKAAEALAVNVAQGNVIDENSVEYNSDPTFLEQGKKVYDASCSACHRIDAGGVNGLGPNLADAYWIHGGTIGEIFKTITYGVPANGMAAWEKSLTSEQRSQVTSYIYSLYGSNPPDAREAQGTLVERAGADAVQIEADSVGGGDSLLSQPADSSSIQ
ncbi:MAG: c-type cytochrome [Cyclobacteriaceae bacterium]|nr:c-type cytochrome [Cyclobacteriaceae bacterium]